MLLVDKVYHLNSKVKLAFEVPSSIIHKAFKIGDPDKHGHFTTNTYARDSSESFLRCLFFSSLVKQQWAQFCNQSMISFRSFGLCQCDINYGHSSDSSGSGTTGTVFCMPGKHQRVQLQSNWPLTCCFRSAVIGRTPPFRAYEIPVNYLRITLPEQYISLISSCCGLIQWVIVWSYI